MIKVTVDLGSKSYPIYIKSGLLEHVSEFLNNDIIEDDIYIITDDNVKTLYSDQLLRHLQDLGSKIQILSVPPGESSKSLKVTNSLYTQLLEKGATRKTTIIAFGGGVVGDLAGFVAATFMRGIRFIQIPTTVLAQVDSSVGGKVGINHPLGKNLIGAFYQPLSVLMDPLVLKTLPAREVKAGFAEIVKYGLIKNSHFFDYVETEANTLMALTDFAKIENVLKACCKIKAAVVALDEQESGLRAILNFGHTMGHALEASTEYKTFLHGEAIFHGMKAAAYISHQKKLISSDQAERIYKLINNFSPPAIPDTVNTDDILRALQKDKKRSKLGQLWVLLNPIGETMLTMDVFQSNIIDAFEFLKHKGDK